MKMEELGARIEMPGNGLACARDSLPEGAQCERWLTLLEEDEAEFLRQMAEEPEANRKVLALYLRYAADQADRWKAKGIPDTVYLDTMRDLTIWYQECLRRTGAPGLVEWEWLLHVLKGRLLRLGRLQYQPRSLEAPLTVGDTTYPQGTPILAVHIPAGGHLDPDAVRTSFRQAQDWFRDGHYRGFHCHSWLLSSALEELLPAESNILQFRALFQVYAEDFSFRQAEERVFGYISDDIAGYPEETGLQRRLKHRLLTVGPIPMGWGWIPFEETF